MLKGVGFSCCFWGPSREGKGSTGVGIKDREGPKVSTHVAAEDAEVGNAGGENEDKDAWKTAQKSKGSGSDWLCPSSWLANSRRQKHQAMLATIGESQ